MKLDQSTQHFRAIESVTARLMHASERETRMSCPSPIAAVARTYGGIVVVVRSAWRRGF
jgi:hypothetical protein